MIPLVKIFACYSDTHRFDNNIYHANDMSKAEQHYFEKISASAITFFPLQAEQGKAKIGKRFENSTSKRYIISFENLILYCNLNNRGLAV